MKVCTAKPFARLAAFLFVLAVSSIMPSAACSEEAYFRVLPYKEVNREARTDATTGRSHLSVEIMPAGDQSAATQDDFIATVLTAAIAYHKVTHTKVVHIHMVSSYKGKPVPEHPLAFVRYIPDCRGDHGKEIQSPWYMPRAVKHGFTEKEMEYSKLWNEMKPFFTSAGRLDEKALEIAISRKLSTRPGSLNPDANIPEKVENFQTIGEAIAAFKGGKATCP